MTAAAFLGGAKSRLLPMSLPFRFFSIAAVAHVLGWAALLMVAEDAVRFRGGPGPVLAAIHLFTLGVLTMTAAGASVQLLPVATRRAFDAVWPIKLLFWLLTGGLLLFVGGAHVTRLPVMSAGAWLIAAALVVLVVLLADNLRRAGSLPVVAAYGWAALLSLTLLAALGVALAADYERAVLPDHGAAALTHLLVGGFGFMGFLAIGFSHVLVPMFALSAVPQQARSMAAFALAVIALVVGCAGALADDAVVLSSAAVAGLAAAGLHLAQMRQVLRTGMRKRLGLSFVLVRVSWAMLPLSLVTGVAALHGKAGPNGATLFGFLLLFGWLLTFLLGILQRIMPFLASMHATPSSGQSPPSMAQMSASLPLRLHAGCHLTALILLAIAIGIDSTLLARVGAATGMLGALAFAWFTTDILRRVLPSRAV